MVYYNLGHDDGWIQNGSIGVELKCINFVRDFSHESLISVHFVLTIVVLLLEDSDS